MKRAGLLPLLFLLTAGPAARAAELITYFPAMNLERFIAENLDISRMGFEIFATHKDGSFHFDDIGLKPTTIEAGQITFQRLGATYIMKLMASGDYNGDGVEDILICFTEKSKQGKAPGAKPYVVTRTAAKGPVRAIAYPRADKPCG
jgi:hypothetical protein